MANIKFSFIVEDINVAIADPAILRYLKMPQIEVAGKMVDKFPSTKALVEDQLENHYLAIVNKGLAMIASDAIVRFDKTIFIKES